MADEGEECPVLMYCPRIILAKQPRRGKWCGIMGIDPPFPSSLGRHFTGRRGKRQAFWGKPGGGSGHCPALSIGWFSGGAPAHSTPALRAQQSRFCRGAHLFARHHPFPKLLRLLRSPQAGTGDQPRRGRWGAACGLRNETKRFGGGVGNRLSSKGGSQSTPLSHTRGRGGLARVAPDTLWYAVQP